jgi:RNA polymerase sigma-54 factor
MQRQSNVQQHAQVQTLKILPQQIQFLNLLHLNVPELENYLQKEIDENPFLEPTPDQELSEAFHSPEAPQNDDDAEDNPFEFRGLEDEIPDYNSKTERGYESEDLYQAPAVQLTNERDELRSQCSFLPIDERMRSLCTYIVDSLDDAGFLPTDLDTLADDISFSKNSFFSAEELLAALQQVQQLDPPGIGARNLQECLLLQLKRHQAQGLRVDLPLRLVSGYMEALAAHDYAAIKTELGIDDEDLGYALEYITSLNPQPLRGHSDEGTLSADTIIPEYVVEVDGDEIFVTLTNGRAETLKIADDAMAMLKSTQDKKAVQFIQKKIQDANWLIEALRQRDDTMLRVMRVIAVLQRDYFLSGDPKVLKPMVLRDVAAYVGMDISTVSRVTSSKYAQTPFGNINLKDLFVHTFTSMDGRELNNQDIQDSLLDIIAAESKSAPLNDTEICTMLAERGYPVARRTVAKYRDLLRIPIAALRRQVT